MTEHPALKNLYEEVVAGKFGWDRWGLLGVLADYILYYNPEGDILEIGCGESSIYLSHFAEKYDRTCYHVEFSRSGVENMQNTKGYFSPTNSLVFVCTSDDFFKQSAAILPTLALSFIDGDHTYEQVRKDWINTYRQTQRGGFVFIHDTKPPDDSWKVPEKCGGVYKLREELEDKWDVDMFTFDHSSFSVGLTMCRKTF
jgi:hypothetical protein